jgi:hypothetical protein
MMPLGKTMVLLWSWRNNGVDYFVGYTNPITNRRTLPVNSISIVTELFEITFIIIRALIISKERSKRAVEIKKKFESNNR